MGRPWGGGPPKRALPARKCELLGEHLLGVFFALGFVWTPTTTNLRCLFAGFVFGSDFGAILAQIVGVGGVAKITLFALGGVAKITFLPKLDF